MTDRLALATLPRVAGRTSVCGICKTPIIRGRWIARLIRPPGWAHLACTEAFRVATQTTAGNPPTAEPKEKP